MIDADATRAILALEERRRLAMLQADFAFLDLIFGDAMVYSHSNGSQDCRFAYLEKLASGRLSYERIVLREQAVSGLLGCCMVAGRMDATLVNGQPPHLE